MGYEGQNNTEWYSNYMMSFDIIFLRQMLWISSNIFKSIKNLLPDMLKIEIVRLYSDTVIMVHDLITVQKPSMHASCVKILS